MPVFAHKVLEAISTRFVFVEGAGGKEKINALKETIRKSEKFDFGELHLEKNDEAYEIPNSTHDELIAFRDRLVPFPSDFFWYEYKFTGEAGKMAILSRYDEENHILYSTRIDWRDDNSLITYDNVWSKVNLSELIDELSYNIYLVGNIDFINQRNKKILIQTYMSLAPMAFYLTLMLGSKSTEIKMEPAPIKLNKHRQKKGREPLPAHRIVRIIPARYHNDRQREADAERRLPRMHFRRSHLRHYPNKTPNAKQLPDGRWAVFIPRQLINKPEHGSVTHEYKVG